MQPLFRDPGEGDEREDGYSEPFGFLLGPMGVIERGDMADQYFRAANLIVGQIQQRNVADFEIAYPVLYLYRHAMELILKTILSKEVSHHRLDALADDFVNFAQDKYRERVPQWVTHRLKELAKIDPTSQALRYGEDKYQSKEKPTGIPAETYVRVLELHEEMNRLYRVLSHVLAVVRRDAGLGSL